jgi:hypothetical protein
MHFPFKWHHRPAPPPGVGVAAFGGYVFPDLVYRQKLVYSLPSSKVELHVHRGFLQSQVAYPPTQSVEKLRTQRVA